jgi:hypothetical protein
VHQPEEFPTTTPLKEIAGEASQALAHLDVDRLEALAASCRAISRDLESRATATRPPMTVQPREAAREMAVLARILDATRANIDVMEHTSAFRSESLEYKPLPVRL